MAVSEELIFFFFLFACTPPTPPPFWAPAVIVMGGDSSPLPSVPTVLGASDHNPPPLLPAHNPTTLKSQKATKVTPYVSLRILMIYFFLSLWQGYVLSSLKVNQIRWDLFLFDPFTINTFTLCGVIFHCFVYLFIYCPVILCLSFFCVSCNSAVWKDPKPGVSHPLKTSCLEREVIW